MSAGAEAVALVWGIWQSGGWVMIALFVLALLLYTQAFHLVMYVRRVALDRKDEFEWPHWVQEPQKARGRAGEILRYAQADVHTMQQVRDRFDEIRLALLNLMQRRTRFVSTLVAGAPLMGLLGTVLGMLQTFMGISQSGGQETAGVIASGISEALVTTQTGLTIALPGLFIVMIIQRRTRNLEAQLARLESLTLAHLKHLKLE